MKTVSAIILLLGLFIPHASSADMAKPSGKTILTVGGDIRETNSGNEAHFDRVMLMALGLALSKQHMELVGGTLDIESRLGVGTIVKLHFPNRVLDADPDRN